MKYKNIYSAIHNFGASFTSSNNYVDNEFVMVELAQIHANGHSIEVDWLDGCFSPQDFATPRIVKSIGYWREGLEAQLASQNVELQKLIQLRFCWPAGGRKFMAAVDDRGKEYKISVNETK